MLNPQDLMLLSHSSSHEGDVILCTDNACYSTVIFTILLSSCVLYFGAMPLTPPGLITVLSQCHIHRSPLTKIPASISRVAASLDRPRPSSAEPQRLPVLQRLVAEVGRWQSGPVAASVQERTQKHMCIIC